MMDSRHTDSLSMPPKLSPSTPWSLTERLPAVGNLGRGLLRRYVTRTTQASFPGSQESNGECSIRQTYVYVHMSGWMPRSRELGVFTLLDKRMIASPSTQPLWPFQSLLHMFSFLSSDLKVPIDISSPSVTLLRGESMPGIEVCLLLYYSC